MQLHIEFLLYQTFLTKLLKLQQTKVRKLVYPTLHNFV